ncbi:integrase core domain protein [Lasius niger]|uniref:Integrase core domain protein n=1 Tax=Lasius niger TaxID=67767 RepID=A0A0J7JUQ8_LASNI|nr:integrase core domain protein [Lasius niger]
MDEANPVSIPADPHQETCTEMHLIDQHEATNALYREAIGSLMYLSIATRPDITFAVNRASRHMEKPSKLHWNAVKRILKYLKGTLNYGLRFGISQDRHLQAYSDSDYAGELETRRSTTGYLVKWGSGIVSELAKTAIRCAVHHGRRVLAACQTVKEIVWLNKLLEELTDSEKLQTTLFLDSSSAIQLIKNPVFHKRTKHIDVRYHYI